MMYINLFSQPITTETTEALASKGWLNVDLKTVQEFLKLDNLDIDEVDLVRALVRWGEHQVKTDPSPLLAWLKDKILPALPLIRFFGMSYKDVMKVCVGELKAVLSAEEKLRIMQSIMQKDVKLLPLNLTTSRARRKKIKTPEIPAIPLRRLHMATLPYAERNGQGNYKKKPFTCIMEFKVDRRALNWWDSIWQQPLHKAANLKVFSSRCS
jgi:hypothetical protein